MVSPVWGHGTLHVGPGFGPVPFLRRARRDRAASWQWSRGRGDRAAPQPFALNGFQGDPAECGHPRRGPRLSSYNGAVACRPSRTASEGCEARQEQATASVCAGPTWWPDRDARRYNQGWTTRPLEGAPPWPAKASSMGHDLESRADRQPASHRLPRRPDHAHLPLSHLPGAVCAGPGRASTIADGLLADGPGAPGASGPRPVQGRVLRATRTHDQ